MVILTLQATSAQALAVPPQKACYAPSSFVHMALWSRAQEHVPWALGHLRTTPTASIRLDTSHARERAMPIQQPTEESPDTAPLLRVLTARRAIGAPTCSIGETLKG